ncbi:MAG: DUF4296 domain-containing protein [Bacteroidetes bacterium]|nr:MAG: DUF4296 domain-containing protein [Bacteroidota bacterium]
MKKLIHFGTGILFVILFCSCGPKTDPPILDDETTIRIMSDLYIAESATTGLTGFPKDSLTKVYYDQVFTMHGVSRERYEENLHRLAQDETRMSKVVYDAMEQIKAAQESEKKTMPGDSTNTDK